MMDADGSHRTQLTNNKATDSHPTWSADGQKIAFGSYDSKYNNSNSA